MTRALRYLWTELTRERGALTRMRAPVKTAPRRRTRQRGVALLAVLVAVALGVIVTSQFSTTTNIDTIATSNYRDQMRAHFLARSALSFAELVIRIQQRLDNMKETRGTQITEYADQLMMAFCGNGEEVQAAIGFSTADIKGLGADVGTCGVTTEKGEVGIGTDDCKLNVNCFNGNESTAKIFKSVLDGLIYFPAYDMVFEDADAEGYRRDRATQVAAIADYIDSDSMRVRDRGTTEDYGYESLKDDYKAKNNYIDTVGELKLVRGVDDRFWSLFGSSFTAYGSCKVNIKACSGNTQLMAALLFLSAKNEKDPVLMDPRKLFTLACMVAKAQQFGMKFSSVDELIEYVKDPQDAITALAGETSMAGSAAAQSLNQPNPCGGNPGEKLSLELDKTKLSALVSTGPLRTYRVKAWGEIDRKGGVFPPIRTTITGVWDSKVVPQNVRKPPALKGAWVFLRED